MVAARDVIIFTPVDWYQTPSVLKLMIDRAVCADGGDPDPTSTHGKKPEEAKAIEMAGWDYPKHLAKRAYGVIVHGDVAAIEMTRRGLTSWLDWLDWMGMIDAGGVGKAGPIPRLLRILCSATRYSTSIPTFRKRCAMWRAPSAMRWSNCAPGGCRSPTGR